MRNVIKSEGQKRFYRRDEKYNKVKYWEEEDDKRYKDDEKDDDEED